MNCDWIAGWYQTFELLAFGRALERCRREYLKDVSDARRVLILGDGDGRFTAEFLRCNETAQVESIDASARMIELAQERAGCDRVRFRIGDARTAEFTGAYDLVVTHFFLDCFTTEDLDRLIERVTEYCEPDARWLISEFRSPSIAARVLIRFMYFCFWLTTGITVTRLPEYTDLLTRREFKLQQRQAALRGLLVSELWQRG